MDLSKNTKELVKLIDLLRKKGVTRLKSGDLELELSPSALFPESAYKKNKEIEAETVVETTYTPEDALYWSSAGIGETN